MRWQEWIDKQLGEKKAQEIKREHHLARHGPEKIERINIAEPPCKLCLWWQPVHRARARSELDNGFALCRRHDDIHHDFSCFEDKTDGQKV